jgi:hypothetical protein
MKKIFLFPALAFCAMGATLLNAQIVSVIPNTVEQGQTLDIAVTAENIDFTQGTNLVKFEQGGTELYMDDVTINNATTLTISATFNIDHPTGYYDLSIWNSSSGITLTQDNAINVTSDPTIASLDSITPENASQGENITMTVYGTNTNFNKVGATNSVYLKNNSTQINASTKNPIDSVTLEAQFNLSYAHPVGLYSVYVNNILDGSISIPDAFELLEGPNVPVIVTVLPDTVEQGQTLDIEVTTANTDFFQGTNVVKFEQGYTELYASDVTIHSATSLTISQTFNIDHPTGYYDLSIWNSLTGVTLTKENAIYLTPDQTIALLDSISPDNATQGETITITVYGTNTNFNNVGVTNTVYLNNNVDIYPISINPINSVTLEAQFNLTYAHPVGLYSINIRNILDGSLIMPDAFELFEGAAIPAILTVTPDTIARGQTLDIEVTAVNTDFTQGTNTVSIKQDATVIFMNSFTANSPTDLIANITIDRNTPLGYYDLFAWNSSTWLTLTKEKAIFIKPGVINIFDYTSKEGIPIFPNPADQYLYLGRKYEMLELVTINGQKILESRQVDMIDISALHEGMYLVKLKAGNDVIVRKLIVK